jgi:hypothetical protein
MPEVVGAVIRPTRLLPEQIGALANDLVQARLGLGQHTMGISVRVGWPSRLTCILAFSLSSSSLGTNFALPAASNAFSLNASSSTAGALIVTGNVCRSFEPCFFNVN